MKKQRRTKQDSDHSDTCQSLPRALPSQVMQTTVKKNYQNLTSIPQVRNGHNIKYLYLSHNQIASLKGIEEYASLVSLNVSYNCLSKIKQLTLIPHPQAINKISLRMNHFQFAYEDEVVRRFTNLSKLEGYSLGNKQTKQEVKRMKQFIAKEAIEFYQKTKLIIEGLSCHFNKENIETNQKKQKSNSISTQFMDSIFFGKLKDIYVYPTHQGLRSKSISVLVNICFNYITLFHKAQIESCHKQVVRQDSYLQQTRQAFKQMVNTILLKYSSRHDYTLRNYLKQIQAEEQTVYDAFSRVGQFESQGQSKLGGEGVKVGKMGVSSSKYMHRLKNSQIINHPMNLLANWKMPQATSLIPLEQTKWYSFNKQQPILTEGPLYQQIPIFIYCKEYLQVITEIILDQVTQILNLQNQIISANKHLQTGNMSQEEIELNLSKSEIMSFGAKQQEDSLDQGRFQQPYKHNNLQQTNIANTRKIPHIHTKQQSDETQFNLHKYSIYQINRVYKAFRSLKINLKKQNRKVKYLL